MEEGKTLIDYLKILSPGTPIRIVIDDLLRARLGALIVLYTDHLEDILEGGFRVNCKFTAQRLFELSKMDGAIIISSDLKRILYANVLLAPDNAIYSNETGTRHKAAERTAKQAETFVVAISERKRKTTLYFKNSKYYLKTSGEILRDISSNLQILEKHREIFDELCGKLNILEMSELVSINDVCKILQRTEIIMRISEDIKRYLTEVGRTGNVMQMRYRELLKGVEKMRDGILRDYSPIALKKSRKTLSNLSSEGLLELESIAMLLFGKKTEESISPKGYRFLSHLMLTEKEISSIVIKFKNINRIFKAESKDFESILKNLSEKITEKIENLREKVLSGKIIC